MLPLFAWLASDKHSSSSFFFFLTWSVQSPKKNVIYGKMQENNVPVMGLIMSKEASMFLLYIYRPNTHLCEAFCSTINPCSPIFLEMMSTYEDSTSHNLWPVLCAVAKNRASYTARQLNRGERLEWWKVYSQLEFVFFIRNTSHFLSWS